ncbi:MAG TPA: NAD(P)H-hydrate dehydratase [Ktedonobacterales bacterium]
MNIVTVDQMRHLEQQADVQFGLNSATLMEHAGRSVAEIVRSHRGGSVAQSRVLVLVGPGNNGGDGEVAARYLQSWGAVVARFVWRERRLETASGSASVGADFAEVRTALSEADIVLDAVLGTGHARPLDPSMRQLFAWVEEERRIRPSLLVVAVDLPTGLNADTGEVDSGTLRADLTITLAYPKVGMFVFPGADYIGELEIGDIGLPASLADDLSLNLLDAATVRPLLPPRPLDSNKGTFGKAMLWAGSLPYPGSAFLAASAAGRVGAGLVTLAVPPELAPIYAIKLSETTLHLLLPDRTASADERARDLMAALPGYIALLAGPGLGQSESTQALLDAVFRGLTALPASARPRLVVDADGLNHLARSERWWEQLPAGSVVTPHPGEMTRLCGGERVSGGGPERVAVARARAAQWGHVVVLKGACTVVAAPDGSTSLHWPPNPALASAGTGDVLAGVITGLLAQGLEPFAAACAGVYLHGRAGLLVSARLGVAGLAASDLLPELPIAQCEVRES